MPVSLETIESEPQGGPPDEGTLEAQEEIPDEAPQATEPPEVDTPLTEIPEELVQEPVTPAPKRRGRPPKVKTQPQAEPPVPKAKPVAKKAPKRLPPPPPSDSDSESSSDSPTASLHRDDLETMMIGYLVQRKNQQMDKRRQMWTQLAGLN